MRLEAYNRGSAGAITLNLKTQLRHVHKGMKPNTPKEQSINRQKNGILRKAPNTNAQGTTRTQAIIPKSITQRFFCGFIKAPIKAMAMAMCPNANQSVPYAMNGYWVNDSSSPTYICSIQMARLGITEGNVDVEIKRLIKRNSH